MALPDSKRKEIEAEARRRGVDANRAVEQAERLSSEAAPGAIEQKRDDGSKVKRPVAERLLIGFLPFIKVRELRTQWLGLTESIVDEELTCSQWQLKHGAAAATGEPPEDEP